MPPASAPPVSPSVAAASRPAIGPVASPAHTPSWGWPALHAFRLRLPAIVWPALAALLSFVAWQPFVRLDFNVWQADDGEYHLLRVYVFGAALKAGEWLPRWTPDLFVGFGYPIFNFYAPGTYYVAMVLR